MTDSAGIHQSEHLSFGWEPVSKFRTITFRSGILRCLLDTVIVVFFSQKILFSVRDM
jgi:hypothetical protein